MPTTMRRTVTKTTKGFASRLALTLLLACAACGVARAQDSWVFFGTHVDMPGRGFSIARFDSQTGLLSFPQFLMQADAPGYFILDSTGSHLYATVSENTLAGQPTGGVSAYAVDPTTAHLTLLNTVPSDSANPAYVSLDATGHTLFVANYTGATVSAFAIAPDGSIGARTANIAYTGHGADPVRQPQPHPHSIRADPTNQFVLVPDLGLDQVHIYRFDAFAGTLTPNDPPFAQAPAASGPRHMVFSPNGKFAYLLSEMASTVTVFSWDSTRGVLTERQRVSTLPEGYLSPSTAAEVRVDPSGNFLYASNRGANTLAVFSIDAVTGQLTPVEQVSTEGKFPRNFDFDPTGHWLIVANHDSENVVVFAIDPVTGKLTENQPPVSVPYPFAVRFLEVPPAPPVGLLPH
ncbi:MAG: lactonase family protein [Candidatus Acidiferrales bacterium]